MTAHRHVWPDGREETHNHKITPPNLGHDVTMFPTRWRRRLAARLWTVITQGAHARYLVGEPDQHHA